jgi:hypothetical protein
VTDQNVGERRNEVDGQRDQQGKLELELAAGMLHIGKCSDGESGQRGAHLSYCNKAPGKKIQSVIVVLV